MTEFKMADYDKIEIKISAILGKYISQYAPSKTDSIMQYRINLHTARPVKY